MDSYMAGQRYMTRRTAPHRRPGRNVKRSSLRRLIAFQTLICIILLFIIIIAKLINISATRFLTDNVRYVLEHNVELKNIYAYAQEMVPDIRNSITAEKQDPHVTDKATAGGYMEVPDETDGIRTDTDMILARDDNEAVMAALSGEMTAQGTVDASSEISSSYDVDNNHEDGDGQFSQTGVLSASSGEEGTAAEHFSSGEEGIAAEHFSSGEEGTAAEHSTERLISYEMIEPVEGELAIAFGKIAGAAGMWKMHNGIDIAVSRTSDVRAALDGYVADAGSSPRYGRYIKVRHDNRLVTVYANCSSLTAEINDIVKKGDVIAGVGGERIDGGRHLHFEVWRDGAPCDPLDYISITAR